MFAHAVVLAFSLPGEASGKMGKYKSISDLDHFLECAVKW